MALTPLILVHSLCSAMLDIGVNTNWRVKHTVLHRCYSKCPKRHFMTWKSEYNKINSYLISAKSFFIRQWVRVNKVSVISIVTCGFYKTEVNTKMKELSCTICSRQFSRKYSLTNHMRTHTGEKPFSCSVCHAAFPKKYALIRHKKIHSVFREFTIRGTKTIRSDPFHRNTCQMSGF